MGRFHTTHPYLGEKGTTFGKIHEWNLVKSCHSKIFPLVVDSNLLKRNGKKQGLKEQLPPHNCQLSRRILKILQCAS